MTGCIYQAIRQLALEHGVRVMERSFEAGKAGEFTGITVTMNVADDHRAGILSCPFPG